MAPYSSTESWLCNSTVIPSAMDLPGTCLVVPTYWTRRDGSRRPGDAVYDHPTPVGGHSTLPPLLDSLAGLDTDAFYVLLIVAVTGTDAADASEQVVRDLASRYPNLTTLVFACSSMPDVEASLHAGGMDDAVRFLNLSYYPKIRNLQLALPLVLGSSAIVAVDDDEVVTDPNFLAKAVEPLGTVIDGRRVDGLSGYYLQEDGGILLGVDPEKVNSDNLYERKAVIMNRATEQLESLKENVVLTPFCFGGNMIFSSDLAAAVGFDPNITRGEDIDYLIDARLEGRYFFMRRDLRILHCPPHGGSYKDANWSKTEQDVIRFIYEREKLLLAADVPDLSPLTMEELMPYPGAFLTDHAEIDAVQALQAVGYPEDAGELVRSTVDRARIMTQEFFVFRKRWPQVIEHLRGDTALREQLLQRVNWK